MTGCHLEVHRGPARQKRLHVCDVLHNFNARQCLRGLQSLL